nr:EOG090X0FYD [Leptodora kindtii]
MRVFFSPDDLVSFDKEKFLQHWYKQEEYINLIESKLLLPQTAPSAQLREWEEKLRLSQSESARRESILLMRLNAKEQETQDLIVQIQELKASQAASAVSLRSSLLDPAVNLLIQHLRKELDKARSALEETQNELSAWKFTPDSNTGKRLMAKCRLLYQENEELGRMISSGRLAKLEGDLALQRSFSEEMKKSQSELDEFLLELDEDVEGMQSTIYYLQQQLRQTREQLAAVQKENELLRDIASSSSSGGGGGSSSSSGSSQQNKVADSHGQHYDQATSDNLINQSCSSASPSATDLRTVAATESEPDSNHFESGQSAEGTSAMQMEEVRGGEEDEDEEEERIGEADTTDDNEAVEERTGVVVCQAVADEGVAPSFSSLPQVAPRTMNGSGEGSPDDGGSSIESLSDQPRPDNGLNENSNDLTYSRADSAVAPSSASTSGHRNSTEVGDLVSGSGMDGMEDEGHFRTNTSSINGQAMSPSATPVAGPHVTGSEDNSSDGGVSSRSSSGKSARKRFRSDPESDGIANGEANDDDDGNNS